MARFSLLWAQGMGTVLSETTLTRRWPSTRFHFKIMPERATWRAPQNRHRTSVESTGS